MSRLPRPLLISTALLATLLPTLAQAAADSERYDCVIEPSARIKVASPVRGIIEEVKVDRGDRVEQGQVIARVKASVEQATVKLLELRAGSNAVVERQREQLAMSEKTFQRAEKLAQTAAISMQQLDELRSDYRVQSRELARTRLEQRAAQMELARARADLELRTIRAPESGVVTEKALSAGEFVTEDSHIIQLVNLNPLHVETFIPIALYQSLSVDQLATVRPVAPFEGEYRARIKVIDPVFDAASGTVGVRLDLPNESLALPAGLRCQVSFDPAERAANSANSESSSGAGGSS